MAQPKEAKTEIKELRSEIERHNDLYYQADSPEISDYEFDQLLAGCENWKHRIPNS